MTELKCQRARVNYTMSYKGIIVGGINEYHPEKMDVAVSITLDHIEGESEADTQKRLDAIRVTEKILINTVGASVAEKVSAIKKRFQSNTSKLNKN